MSGTASLLTASAAQAADAAMAQQLTALDKRVSALESGSTASGHFTVGPAGFKDQAGKPWRMRGLNCKPGEALAATHLFDQFPHLSCLRITCNSTDASELATIGQVVSQFTPRVVLEIEDHYGGPGNTAWYQQMARTYASNPCVFLETPNEPKDASPQHGIISAIRAAGFNGPVGIMAANGWDFSTIAAAAQGQTNVYAVSHIYYNGTDPNEPAKYVSSDIGKATALGLWLAVDEFGEAVDGWHRDQWGDKVTSSVIAAEQALRCGAAYWGLCNDYHADGTCSAVLVPDASQLTPTGAGPLKAWLSPA